MGKYLIGLGKKHQSIIMTADGKHLISDTVSSIGLVIGLLVIHLTKLLWLDHVIAILFGVFIFYTGYKLLKQSITGLLDEADYENLEKLIVVLNENRSKKWIDMHNLRVLKYGHTLHIDAHITLPWYDNLENTHHEVIAVENLIKDKIPEIPNIFFIPPTIKFSFQTNIMINPFVNVAKTHLMGVSGIMSVMAQYPPPAPPAPAILQWSSYSIIG
jgi:cation diffusion facilitator family transporter